MRKALQAAGLSFQVKDIPRQLRGGAGCAFICTVCREKNRSGLSPAKRKPYFALPGMITSCWLTFRSRHKGYPCQGVNHRPAALRLRGPTADRGPSSPVLFVGRVRRQPPRHNTRAVAVALAHGIPINPRSPAERVGGLRLFRDDEPRRRKAVQNPVHKENQRQRNDKRGGHRGNTVQIAEDQILVRVQVLAEHDPDGGDAGEAHPGANLSITCRRALKARPRPISGIINTIWLLKS